MGTLNNMVNNEDTVTVEWPNFGQALGHDMWQFFMKHEYSDVTICTEEGDEIPSHRIILAMCSPYFRDLFKTNRTANPIVCLSNIRFDVVKKILQLIYSGAVEVPACEMRSFVKAAKYLRLQGFENVASTATVNDIFGRVPVADRCFSIKLKRIDEDGNYAMDTASAANDEHADEQADQVTTTNGDDPEGENNGSSSSSDSSDDGSVKGADGHGGNADADDENNIGKNIVRQANAFPLSSSSSECGNSDSGTEDEHSDVAVDID